MNNTSNKFDEKEYLRDQLIDRVKDIIGGLIGIRSEWLGDEDDKAAPDQAIIQRLVQEQSAYDSLRWDIALLSHDELAKAVVNYGAQLEAEQAQRVAFLKAAGSHG